MQFIKFNKKTLSFTATCSKEPCALRNVHRKVLLTAPGREAWCPVWERLGYVMLCGILTRDYEREAVIQKGKKMMYMMCLRRVVAHAWEVDRD